MLSLSVSISGLIILSLTGGIPQAPFEPAPRTRFNKSVSALSLRLCAVAILPLFPARERKKSYLTIRPHSSSPIPCCFESLGISACKISSGTFNFSQRFLQLSSSLCASAPRMPWFICAAISENPYSALRELSTLKRQTESAPPESPTTILSQFSSILYFLITESTSSLFIPYSLQR